MTQEKERKGGKQNQNIEKKNYQQQNTPKGTNPTPHNTPSLNKCSS